MPTMCVCMLADIPKLYQIVVIKQFERLQSADCFMQIAFMNAEVEDMILRYLTRKSRDFFADTIATGSIGTIQ